VYRRAQRLVGRDRPATQIARIRLDPDGSTLPLNATVTVRMHYSALSGSLAEWLAGLLGPY